MEAKAANKKVVNFNLKVNDREGENVSGVLIICQVLWDSCLPKQHYHNEDTGKLNYLYNIFNSG